MSAVGSPGRHFGRAELISLVIALVWGAGLVIAAVVAPVYQTSGASSGGAATSGSATLVGVNGWGVLLVAGAPLIAALVTGGALRRRAGLPGAGILAWAVTGLLICGNVLAMLSIGAFVVPVTVALAVACVTHGSSRRGVVPRSGFAS